mmetsp:Transcript_29413/g.32557  ORF Transcript_29413/g.32557 Transcript_29413/m.32557 type:complete len:314 (+) Transcript_29413:82-1023(+)
MAARNSCTHLTWSEAKGKAGIDGGKKKKLQTKNISHDKALANKIIAKNGPSQGDLNKHKMAARRDRKAEERFAAASAKYAKAKEKVQKETVMKPYEQSKERMSNLVEQLANASSNSNGDDVQILSDDNDIDIAQMNQILECKEMQLDEIMALEAIFCDTPGQFLTSTISDTDGLREKIEEAQMDPENESYLRSVVKHPPLTFYLCLENDNYCGDRELVANLLLRVTYPPLYPLYGLTPIFSIQYFMVTDKNDVCSIDKVLESLAHLEEEAFQSAIQKEAQQLLPDPCIYELSESWLSSDTLWNFVKIHAMHNK